MVNSGKRPLEEAPEAPEEKKRRERIYHGLHNQGNTCYLNSVLQVLFMTPEMHGRLDTQSHSTDKELGNIFKKLRKRTCRTEDIIDSLEIKDVSKQRDAAECLEIILHKVSPEASKVFQGQLRYTTECFQSHTINEETNPFWILPLSLKEANDEIYSVEKNFAMIFHKTTFSGNNMVYCSKCDTKTTATSECVMTESPQILILLLKRFAFDDNSKLHVKSDCSVEVPRVLHMKAKNKKYELYGIVNHMGSLRSGHYTATVRSSEDRTWYEFNDDCVQKAKEQLFTKHGTYNSRTAYLIVYRASRSPRDELKDRPDETRHMVEHKTRTGGKDADDKDQGRNRESLGHMRTERSRGPQPSTSHHVHGEDGDPRREKAASFGTTEESLLHPKPNTSHSSKHQRDTLREMEMKKQWSSKEDDDGRQQPCGCLPEVRRSPVRISLIVVAVVIGVILIVVLPVVLTN